VASFQLSESAIARLEAELRKEEQRAQADRLAWNQGGYRNPAPSSQKFEVFERISPSAPVTRRDHNLRRRLYALIACVIATAIAYKLSLRELFEGSAAVHAVELVPTTSNNAAFPSPPASESKQMDAISATSPVTTLSEPTVSVEREIPSRIATLSQGTRSSESETPAAATVGAPLSRDQSATSAGRKLDTAEIKLLMDRGKRFAGDGDLASARLLFQRAAEAGDAAGALALGATYDPAIIGRLGVVGMLGDVNKARVWYEKAAALGSSEAARRLGLAADR
jgi:TPR repeat protein